MGMKYKILELLLKYIGISIVYSSTCMYHLKMLTETFKKIFAWMKKKTNMIIKQEILCDLLCGRTNVAA